MDSIYNRQNDATGILYIRAYKYCQKQKLIITTYMIIVSLLITLASIAVKIASNVASANGVTLSSMYSQAVVLISGVVLITNIFLSFLDHEFNVLSINFLERYDIHVFNLPINKAILRPISEQAIINYARKFKSLKKIKKLKDYYFKSPEEAEQKNIAFTNIKKNFEYNYRLLLDVRSIFMFFWLGYVVLIMLIAFLMAGQDSFIETVINIFVPSLSSISLIVSAWRRHNEQSRKLVNSVNVANEVAGNLAQRGPEGALQSQNILRNLQDALFNQRISDFTVPEFMIKRFDKKLRKEQERMQHESFDSVTSAKGKRKKPKTFKSNKPKVNNSTQNQNATKTNNGTHNQNTAKINNGAQAQNTVKANNGTQTQSAAKANNGTQTQSAAKVNNTAQVQSAAKASNGTQVQNAVKANSAAQNQNTTNATVHKLKNAKTEDKPTAEKTLKTESKPKAESKPKTEKTPKTESKPKAIASKTANKASSTKEAASDKKKK